MRTEKIAVWFMPEGHRNTGAELLPFKSGAFRLAIAAQAPIIPIVSEPLTVIADTNRRLARRGRLQSPSPRARAHGRPDGQGSAAAALLDPRRHASRVRRLSEGVDRTFLTPPGPAPG